MTVADLQKIADEITTAYNEPSMEVRRVAYADNGFDFEFSTNAIRVTQDWLDRPNLRKFRFKLAKQVGARSPSTRAGMRLDDASIWIVFVVVCSSILSDAIKQPTLKAIATLVLVVSCALGFAVAYLQKREAKTLDRPERSLRLLLEVTRDPIYIRQDLRAKNATPDQLAKLDALEREMGLEQNEDSSPVPSSSDA